MNPHTKRQFVYVVVDVVIVVFFTAFLVLSYVVGAIVAAIRELPALK